MSDSIDLGLSVVDRQLIDVDGRQCGKVDDLALEGGPGEELRVVAILSGPGVWPGRAPVLGRIAAWIGRGSRVRVPWDEVADVTVHVELKRRAGELGLGRGDDRVRPWVDRIPGADR